MQLRAEKNNPPDQSRWGGVTQQEMSGRVGNNSGVLWTLFSLASWLPPATAPGSCLSVGPSPHTPCWTHVSFLLLHPRAYCPGRLLKLVMEEMTFLSLAGPLQSAPVQMGEEHAWWGAEACSSFSGILRVGPCPAPKPWKALQPPSTRTKPGEGEMEG